MFYGKEVMSAAEQPVPRPAETSMDFTQALAIFRDNYTKYRVTGESTYKAQYMAAETWINRYLASMQTGLDAKAAEIRKFVADYQTANPELVDLQRKFRVIREEGPRLQDTYSTVRRMNTEIPEIDYTEYYVKAGLVVTIVGLIVVLSR